MGVGVRTQTYLLHHQIQPPHHLVGVLWAVQQHRCLMGRKSGLGEHGGHAQVFPRPLYK